MTLKEQIDKTLEDFRQKHQAQSDVDPFEMFSLLQSLLNIHNEAIKPLRGEAGTYYLVDSYSAHYPQA